MRYLYVFLLCTLQLMKYVGGESEVHACGGKAADIMFVLDTSGSISYDDFRKEINFTRDVISIFDVSPERTHVGIINFSSKVIKEMDLGDIQDRDDVLAYLSSSNIQYQGGGTHTGEALHSLWTDAFVPGVMRPEVSHIAIVLTDGMSYDMAKTKAEAMEVKRRGITVFVIGIGSNMSVDTQELTDIASEPTQNYMFQIANFDALNSIKSELAFKACEQPPATTPAPTVAPVMNDNGDIVCVPRDAVNLVFGFDITAIGTGNAKFILQFIHNMYAELPKTSERMTVSVISGGECDVQNGGSDALIDNAHSTDEIDQRFNSLSTKAFNSIMKRSRHKLDRRARKKYEFLFLDKRLGNRELAQAERERKYAAFRGINVYVIGVGDQINKSQVKILTTGGNNYFHVDRYENIDDVRGKVLCAIS